MLFRADSVTKAFGPVHVLTDASIQINEHDAIGLIGINGAGKSTFIKILLGIEPCDTGEITRRTRRIGYLEQFAESSREFTVRDVLGRPYGHIENIRRRMAEIDELMASGKDNIDWNGLATEYADLEQKLANCDIADEKKLIFCLEEVGLSRDLMDRTMDTLSGGERTKVMLARIVVQAEECDILIMDEPTSHLDIDTIEWLEDFLLKSRCAVLVVSHDRYFLDKMAVKMVEIENGKTREYRGNYSQFVMKKMLDLQRQEREWEKYNQAKRTQEAIAERLRHDQWYAATYKTREKMIAKMEVKQKPEEFREIRVQIQAAHKSGKNVFLMKDCAVAYEKGKPNILEHVNLDIRKGDKIGIFGANGQGKTTLVKALLEEIPVTAGELWTAPGNKVGYYSQHHENLDLRLSAEEQLLVYMGKEHRAEARQMLGRFLLFGDAVERPMSTLSGGQRCRVALAVLLMRETNVLVLDEPTNYLDIPARHAIEEALTEYDGTIITVTHDRYFLDSVCTSVIEVKDGKAIPYAGTYSEMKGRPNITEIVMDADEYRVLAPFTNWATGMKYKKGDRVLVAPNEQENYQWAIDQGKIKKTGGRQRKKVAVQDPEKGE
ncbi:ATPase component of ABC transporters with duplicated ATPase domains [Thermoplasmatales archaeon BRNA1]|nr:ATPase component of ABC transporters with duplicated ATPase domains [Thermoplasmatales archaeon BRNA1]